ncbi:uncharacterized protein LOC127101941 [Lathyrus oleraceus]|uniref:uncharacterized protein LOC127101941 n=1 Tax=Pisum sativum TaxID=3888 RepID=UPI0021D227F3|nr:uncharacterized protein LOC127101941 [Pisum sativum]
MVDMGNQGVEVEPPRVEQPVPIEREPRVLVVNRNQVADEFIRQVRRNNMATDKNLATMVERIMTPNRANVGLHRPNYTSLLSEYILRSELPPRWKVPNFMKFSRDTSESTVEHVARYLIKLGDIANNENLISKITLKELTNIKRKFTELIDEYLNRFHLLKARVRQVEHLKAEKARVNKNNMRERVAYVELYGDDQETYNDFLDFDESEIDLVELK